MSESSLMGELVALALAYDEPWSIPVPTRHAEGMAYAEAQAAWTEGVEQERQLALVALWTPQDDEGDLTPRRLYRLLHETVARTVQLGETLRRLEDQRERLSLLGRVEVLSRLSRHLTHVAAHTAQPSPSCAAIA